ncbi:RagB/SusD family nutrient uptake outer membrane protein [candidate division KSB1 bacterium]|nr:RagB/SusD family nutrient uptake outer membrane protein [candidate division KSB1 bacterium]NIS26266.1 RagB/SusD family nutrient uptake outer membrane protein [candidate division KSB1 bacterium]NIT73028.1 RagB/SusD family nutrient uptake outer membrane protein [candidate division KSB1 bacterium]NIU26915.1 RagB/SusD family nutrient uptake outer membrane protein [candidate division KSB1 bacterium]NIU89989.1 RagB/SusD family nutrient uptake outer membrane protein [candidate division KSB1 bacteri
MKRHRKQNARSNPRLLSFGLIVLISISLGCKGLEFSNPNSPDLSGASLQSLVAGSEAGMRIDLDVYLQVTITIGREGYFFEPADPRFTGEIIFGPVDPGGFLTLRPWSARYQVVFNCNELLLRAEELSDPQKSAVEGYAKTIRGYQLLLNLNYLDENGIRLNFDGDLTKPFATKEEAFDFIENDLNEANTALASAGDSFPFRLSDGFAGFDTPSAFARFNRAVMARVLVFRGKFDQALQVLEQSFLEPAGDLNLGVFHIYGTGLGDQLNPVFQVPTAPFVKLMAHPSFEADAEPGDLRVQNKVFKRSDVTVFDELNSDLAITLATTSTDPFPIIRATRS